MGKYVDGFLIPIAEGNIEKYREVAQKAGEIWKEHGALEYIECVGDDLDDDKWVSFKNAAGAGAGETVIFSWIIFESKEHRDKVNAAVMEDPRLKEMVEDSKPSFDYKRMAYGGFKTLVEL
jgi:uncharacterized protein YbaA (DUF1428 family)